MNPRRVAAISAKEFIHIIRDPRTLLIIFIMPVLLLMMFGYAFNLEIQDVRVAVIDDDNSALSRQLIERFEGSPFFTVFHYQGSREDLETLFLERDARAILSIPENFAATLIGKHPAGIQVIIDATDPNAATSINNYCRQIVTDFNTGLSGGAAMPFTLESNIWYNPEMRSAPFFVPGILALLLIMISALLTSITITREKESGTLEQILVSPIRPGEIIIGKVLPYILIAFLDGSMILILGVTVFKVPFVGSLFLLALLMALFVLTALSLGLILSTIASTQQVAMMLAFVLTLLPTLLLSGFIFPLASMPLPLQLISTIVPAKYFLVIVRGILLKGNTIAELLVQVLWLAGMSVVLLTISWRKFSTNLER